MTENKSLVEDLKREYLDPLIIINLARTVRVIFQRLASDIITADALVFPQTSDTL